MVFNLSKKWFVHWVSFSGSPFQPVHFPYVLDLVIYLFSCYTHNVFSLSKKWFVYWVSFFIYGVTFRMYWVSFCIYQLSFHITHRHRIQSEHKLVCPLGLLFYLSGHFPYVMCLFLYVVSLFWYVLCLFSYILGLFLYLSGLFSFHTHHIQSEQIVVDKIFLIFLAQRSI